MKTIGKMTFLMCCLLLSGTIFAQAHTLTYQKKSRPVDSIVNFAGEAHTIVRLPVRDFVSGDKYAVIFPAPAFGGIFTAGVIGTGHNTEPFVPNMQIDSFPAQVYVSDGLTYSITADGLGGYDFVVTGSVTVVVTIDLGNTLMTITNSLSAKNKGTGSPALTNVNTGSTANAVPFANWGRYVDQVALVDALDRWLDFIRVIPL